MRTQQAWIFSMLSAGLLSASLTGTAMAAGGCAAAVASVKVEWRALTHGNTHVAGAQTIVSSDGRRFAGTLLNYGWVLINRAESACEAAQVEQSMDYVHQAHALFHPESSKL
jgi:hypothetical protein